MSKVAFAGVRLRENLVALRERNSDSIDRMLRVYQKRATIGLAFHEAREEAKAAELSLEVIARQRAKGEATAADVAAADERLRRAQLDLRGYEGASREASSAVDSCRSKFAALVESIEQEVARAARERRAIAAEVLTAEMVDIGAAVTAVFGDLPTETGEPLPMQLARSVPELNSARFEAALRQLLGEGRGMVSVTLRDGRTVAPDSLEAAAEQAELKRDAMNAGPDAQSWKPTGTMIDDNTRRLRESLARTAGS